MVLSQIDKSIEYPAVKFVDSEDLDYDAQLYQIELFPDLEVIIALGKVKYIFIDKNVLYIPVYLTNDGEVILQMGVYEFPSNIYTSLLDEDNDFDISLLENPLPLLYKFINESLIRKELGQKKKQTPTPPVKPPTPPAEGEMEKLPEQEKTDKLPEQKKTDKLPEPKKSPSDDFTELSKDSRVPNKQTIIEELFAEDDDEKPIISDEVVSEEVDQETNFKEHSGHNWVEKFMKNENYGIVDNESGGDCLFATIRDAYSGIGKTVTVEALRSIASNAATEEVFRNFKEQYDMYDTEVKTLSTELAKLQTTNRELKQQL